MLKIFLVAFIGVHTPLLVFIAYVLVKFGRDTIPLQSLSVVLIATLIGTAATFLALRALLSPLYMVADHLTDWSKGRKIGRLPDHFDDQLGKLMRVNNRVIAQAQTDLDRSRREAETDPLTGLWNRRGAERQMAQAKAGHLLLLDIDLFKAVNDTYGHDVGDEVLVEIARKLEALLRPDDMIARFGGEEFVIFISTPDRLADEVAERLRKGIAERENPGGGGQTVSIGIAEHTGGPDFSNALTQADHALYRAKQQGRNQVIFWTENRRNNRLSTEQH